MEQIISSCEMVPLHPPTPSPSPERFSGRRIRDVAERGGYAFDDRRVRHENGSCIAVPVRDYERHDHRVTLSFSGFVGVRGYQYASALSGTPPGGFRKDHQPPVRHLEALILFPD